MKKISWKELRTAPLEELKKVMPAIVEYNGEPVGVFANLDGVIVIEDLHPRVQHILKAHETRARMGMPPVQRVYPATEK